MHHVRALDRGIIVGALDLGVEPVDRRGLGDIEAFALRDTFRDVEQDDVAEFLQSDEMGERAADLAGADERDLVTGHKGFLQGGTPMRAAWMRGPLTQKWWRFKPRKG